MSQLINASICLNDIPKDKIQQGTNGKKYLNICIAEMQQPDRFGKTHTIYISQTARERQSKAAKIYVGKGANWMPGGSNAAPHNPAQPANPFASGQAPESQKMYNQDDDLPF